MRISFLLFAIVLHGACKEAEEIPRVSGNKPLGAKNNPSAIPRQNQNQNQNGNQNQTDDLEAGTGELPGVIDGKDPAQEPDTDPSGDPVVGPVDPTDQSPGQTLPAFCSVLKKTGDWSSSKAFYGANGKMEYPSDAEKNRIPDFSYAGYRYGEIEAPLYPVVKTLAAIKGDNTAAIQKAIDELSSATPDAKGIRGAILLSPGSYTIQGTLKIKASGVVLRGSGDGNNPARDTILMGSGNTPHQRPIIVLGTGIEAAFKTTGSAVEVTSDFVPVGSMDLSLASTSAFKVGDWVQIKHPSSQAWIDAIGGGGMVSDDPWKVGSTDILFNRRIQSVQGSTIRLDAPIYNHLNRRLAVSTVSKLQAPALIRESGVESLRIDIQTKGGEDENHAWDGVSVYGAEDSWVRKITVLHFGQAGVVTRQATRITIDQVTTLEPVGIRTGERFYNFNAEAMSQLILVKNCTAKDGRHNFISNGVQTSSGLVYYKCTSDGDSQSEGHRRWSTGMLFDSIKELGKGAINIYNRADYGTSHGWASVHSVIWNYNGSAIVQKPPTAQNYLVAEGAVLKRSNHPGAQGPVEIQKGSVVPSSLYEAQLCERLSLRNP